MFIGVQSKKSIIINLILCCLFLGTGIWVSVSNLNILRSEEDCGVTALSIAIGICFMMVHYIAINVLLLLKNKLDPRRRKWFNRFVVLNRWVGLISNIIILSVTINERLFFNSLICLNSSNFSLSLFLTIFNMLISVELLILSIIFLLALFVLFVITCLVCCGTIEIERESANNTSSVPGTAYLNRTQVETFKNFTIGLLDTDNEKETQCPICLEQYAEEDKLRKMPCNHYYHQDCIDSWLEHHSECPICKQNIRDGESRFSVEP